MTTTFLRAGALSVFLAGVFVGTPVSVQANEPELTFSVVNVALKPKPPTCEARSTKRRIVSGGATEIVWRSKNASYMLGIVDGEVWPTDGRRRIALSGPATYEFPLVFVGKGGLATCYAKVEVRAERKR